MLSVSIMAVPLAAGHGINDGTRKIQGGTRMAKRQWTDSQLSDAKYLMAHNFSASKVGNILNTTKNAVLGALYQRFAALRTSDEWQSDVVPDIQAWLKEGA